MADQPGPKVALTRAQIEEGVGAELLSLLVGIAEDGKLAKDELVQLGLWLHRNRGGSLPGIAFLDATMTRILADGRISSAEQDELLGAIEKVLPIAWRKPARAARLEHLARRKQCVARRWRGSARRRRRRSGTPGSPKGWRGPRRGTDGGRIATSTSWSPA